MQIPKILQERIALLFKMTTLHGLKYIGQPVASKIERIFWLFSFVVAAGFATYFISTMFDKFNNNRVMVSINSKSLSTSTIPFPTVTICNMNRVNNNRGQAFIQNGTESEKRYVYDFCDFHNTSTTTKLTGKPLEKDQLINSILQLSPSCQDMLKMCKWQLQEIDCNSIFTTILTDIGACCSFNGMPLDYILRNPTIEVNIADAVSSDMIIQDWNFETGYSTTATNTTYPRPLKGTGLSVVLDTAVAKYYCSSTNSVGFKLAVTNPTEIPRLKYFAINVFPGTEATIAVSPVIVDSTKDLESIPISNRRCYFNNEKYLMFYRTYTINNCITECEANYTLQKCDCLPYFLMANSSIQVCGKEHESCMADVLELVAINEESLAEKSKCKCLPRCYELNFSKHISYGRLANTFNISQPNMKNLSADYVAQNMIVLNIHHPGTTASRYTKSEIYGSLELFANIGGLLSIFLGFSFLNAAEILYHLICRICPIIIQIVYANFVEKRKVFPFTK